MLELKLEAEATVPASSDVFGFRLTKNVIASASFWRMGRWPNVAKGHGHKLLC
jgi:hypothetical protein